MDPQRNPTTFPRGTILILTLAGGGVGVVTASRGSGRQEISVIPETVRQTSDRVRLRLSAQAAAGTVTGKQLYSAGGYDEL